MKKIILFGGLAVISWAVFIMAVFQIPYPDSLAQANYFQVIGFFIPLLLALTFSLNIFLQFLIRSILISFTLIVLLILQALQSLNIITFALTAVAFGLLVSYFKKQKNGTSGIRRIRRIRV